MGNSNLKENITKILKNKNTLTVLIVFAGIIGLYAVYNYKVKQATQLVPIPYAKKELNSRNKIEAESIATVSVPKSLVSNAKNLIKSSRDLEGKYVNYGYTIPANSFFYSQSILQESSKPESEFANIPDGFTVFQLDVDFDSTYGNSIYPGNYIDLYVAIKQKETNQILFGRLIKGIQVMAVYDGSGNNVFESASEARKPSKLWFSVTNDYFKLLKTAEYIGAKLIPIPRNASYSAEQRPPEIDSETIENYILAKGMNFNE